MAGGIFPNQPFTLNAKCVVFSLLIIGLFFIDSKPFMKNNVILTLTLFILFVIAYVAMAWYDYFFDCQILPLKRGSSKYTITGKMKPPLHNPEKQLSKNNIGEESRFNRIIIYTSHLILIVPFIAYIAYMGKNTPKSAYIFLATLAVFTTFYHGINLIGIFH